MGKSIFILTFFLCLGGVLQAQDNYDVAEGDILVLGKAQGLEYKHIDFPKKNIIIKRGALANFNAIVGQWVVVDKLKTKKDGTAIAILKRKDGRKFFRFYPTVKANLNSALNSGELKTIDLKKRGAIAQK